MGARPGPGFPACPSTGPAKGALAVGGGRGLALRALLLSSNPGAESAGSLSPHDSQSLSPYPCSQFSVLQVPACAPRREGSGLQ